MYDYSTLIKEVESLKDHPPPESKDRKALLRALREAEFAVERPYDTIHRLSWAPILTAVAKTAVDLKLFNIISASKAPVPLDELAKQTGADAFLLRRLLRLLSLNGMVDEPTATHYLANDRTRTMSEPEMMAGLSHNYNVQGAAYRKIPDHLRNTNYQFVTDKTNTSFNLAFGTKVPCIPWMTSQPEVIQEFSMWMSAHTGLLENWLDTFPTDVLFADTTSDTPLLLDIGGGFGHQCKELMRRYPDTKRQVILQDQPPVIAAAIKTPGVTNQVYDFFTPQPVGNASFYYMKSVLHDWPDDEVIQILRNQTAAMGPHSKILLDEIVLPERGSLSNWRAIEMDIALMANLNSFERTELQWLDLFRRAGVKKVAQYVYDDQLLYSIQVLEPVYSLPE